jgi:YD repeat-containing protein
MFDFSPPVAFASRGLLSVSVNPATANCLVYDAYGVVRMAVGSDGSTTTATSDSSTNYAAPSSLSTTTYSETVSYNSWLGVTATTGLNGETLSMTYDSYGRPATGTSPYGATWTYGYTSTTPIQQTKTGPDGFTRTTLDGLGRTIRVERGMSSSNIQSVTDTVYAPCACSPLGKIQKVSAPYSPSVGASAWTVYVYDGIGRTVSTSVQRPDGTSTSTYSYSGNQTTVTDEAGKWKTFTSDVPGNLTTVTEPDPANPPSGTLTTHYGYDWMKHLVCVDMVRGAAPPAVPCDPTWQTPAGAVRQTRSFVYNGSGLLTSATNPENGTVLYYYNADNTLYYKHDAKGQDTVYTYDSAKRVTEIQRYPTGKNNAEDTCRQALYTYDTNSVSSSFSQYAAGRLTTAVYPVCTTGGTLAPAYSSTPGGTVTEMYSYHPAGAVTAKQMRVFRGGTDADGNYGTGYGSVEADYSYDGAGNVVTYELQYPTTNGSTPSVYTYSYDGMERPVGLTAPWQQGCILNTGNEALVQNVSYDFAGRMTGMQFKTGQTTSSVYTWLDPDTCGGWGYYTQYTDSYTSKAMAYNADLMYPKAMVQLCIVHMVRHSLNYVSWKQRRTVAADLRLIYTAPTEQAAELDADHAVFCLSGRDPEGNLHD